jgi:ferredoxin
MNASLYVFYAAPLLLTMIWYLRRHFRAEKSAARCTRRPRKPGPRAGASLHPSIDPVRCLGCGACVRACPEQPHHHVLGLIEGKAHLVSPTECIGHGACKSACPVDAITLVFGTETRGVDLPVLNPNFETNVPGVYIAGELGGMGLIRNALVQGRQAIESIAKQGKRAPGKRLDVLIVGGPAGMAAALTAKSLNLTYRVVGRNRSAAACSKYPRGKLVDRAGRSAAGGQVSLSPDLKEQLLTV